MKTRKSDKKKFNTILNHMYKMKLIAQLLLVLFPIPLSAGLGYQLDVLLGVSLKKGGMLPKQSRAYLLDSFRTNSLIPAFERIQEELENLNSSDHWMIFVLILLSLWTAIGNLLFVWRLRRLAKKRSKIRVGPPV